MCSGAGPGLGRLESDTDIGLCVAVMSSGGTAEATCVMSWLTKETVLCGGRGGILLGLLTEQYTESRAKL